MNDHISSDLFSLLCFTNLNAFTVQWEYSRCPKSGEVIIRIILNTIPFYYLEQERHRVQFCHTQLHKDLLLPSHSCLTQTTSDKEKQSTGIFVRMQENQEYSWHQGNWDQEFRCHLDSPFPLGISASLSG